MEGRLAGCEHRRRLEKLSQRVGARVAEAAQQPRLGALRIPSISAHGRALGDSAGYLTEVLGRDGWSVVVDEIDGNPIVLAEIGPGTGSGPILYGHHDVQPVDPASAWETPPFDPTVRDGRLVGRGTADNKGQFFCHIFAVRALRRALGDVPGRVRLVLDGHDEIGSPEMPEFVERHRDRLGDASFCLTADGPTRLEEQPEVVFGVRGALKLKLTVRTASTDLHSGNWGGLAPIAIWRLAHVLACLKGEDGRVLVPGFYDRVVPPTEAERLALADIPFDAEEARTSIDARALDGPPGTPPLERVMFLPTMTVNGVQGGYRGDGFKTVIPARRGATWTCGWSSTRTRIRCSTCSRRTWPGSRRTRPWSAAATISPRGRRWSSRRQSSS